MKQNFGSESGVPAKNDADNQSDGNSSSDSRDSVPALTGNTHILMERDFFEKKYELEQNGKKIELSDTHFQPIFFAKGTNELRGDVTA